MKKLIITIAALVAFGTVAARAEQVQCPTGIAPEVCAQNQAIHDAFLAGSYIGPNPVFVAEAVDPRAYLGSDPDANVRLALRKTLGGEGAMAEKK